MSTPRDSSPTPLRSSGEQSGGGPVPSADVLTGRLFDYVVALADDALVNAQRLGWWISRAPQLEEDVALANIGLDQLGQARSLLAYAGEVEGAGRSEDDLAYFRDERSFRNTLLVERSQEDFGVAMARLLIVSAWQSHLYAALRGSTDATLAAVSAKAVKEVAYHLDHAGRWVVRLGDGTDESHARMQAALDAEWPFLEELFDGSFIDPTLIGDGVAVDPATLRDAVLSTIGAVVDEATLTVPDVRPALGGGRSGRHTEQMGFLLAEMQHLTRSHPGATW
ncbi:1,2-phenylacetyl-CoA epoxidase subunit PaaC [Nocardioides sp. InS609-2]|uniref:1,2-phenylacetyl-CoA epoxidase subunit PaaC n=1 Tax=Nocardioides sp. InS609-2 TaxID=2760705 RepID=UPI0020C0A8AD|nr:1,2-phenylacetyl-CoA epoxidase subunit PaaC [Nocardioides sp. InS609-2]